MYASIRFSNKLHFERGNCIFKLEKLLLLSITLHSNNYSKIIVTDNKWFAAIDVAIDVSYKCGYNIYYS